MNRKVHGARPVLLWCLLALIWLASARAGADPTHPETFTFVALTDTHIGRGRDADRLRVVVDQIRRLEPLPRLVVIAGDLTDGGTEAQLAEYLSIIAALPVPVFDIPGNHDIGFTPTPASIARYRKLTGRPDQPNVMSMEGRHFVGFNSMLLRRAAVARDRGMEHLQQLEQLLAGLPPGPVYLVTHIPPVENVKRGYKRSSWAPAGLQRFREILLRRPVTAVLAGHFHRDELHFVAGAPLMVLPATGSRYEVIASFRVITDDVRGIRYRQVYCGPQGHGGSYYADLRGVDEQEYRRRITQLSPAELDLLWLRRYTGSVAEAATAKKLTPEFLRHLILSDPSAPYGEIGLMP